MTAVSFPARCAVAVICGESLISQVYPATVPVEVFLDNAIELLNDDLKRRGAEVLDPQAAYELQRTNGTRLDISKTLEDMGIEDGNTLVVVPAGEGDSFEPQYESLSTGLAMAGKTLFPPVTAETAVSTAMAITGSVALTLIGLSVEARLESGSTLPGFVGLGLGVILLATGLALWRRWPKRRDLLSAAGWLAVPLISVGLAISVPGELNVSHLFILVLATAALTWGVAALSGHSVTIATAIVACCLIVALVAGTRMWISVSSQRLGMATLVALLLVLTAAPTMALWVARIRPPHFGSITGRDVFTRRDGMPADAVAPVDEDGVGEPDSDTTPRGVVLVEAATRANGVLTGICLGAAIMLPAAVWATVTPEGHWAGATGILAILFIGIFISRARAFTDRRQAVALVCGATAGLCSAVVRYVSAAPGGSLNALIPGALVLTAFGTAGVGAALLVPVTRFTPLVRMVTEWLELAAIVLALPLAAWIGGLFEWVRMR